MQANAATLLPVPGNAAIAALLPPLIGLAMLRGVAALAPFSLAADFAMISGKWCSANSLRTGELFVR